MRYVCAIMPFHQWSYYYAGITVTSQIELPEWRPFLLPECAAVTDVRILLKSKDEHFPADRENLPCVTAEEFCFFAPEAGHYKIRNGAEISVFPVPGTGLRELRLFLLGTAWGVLCYQRGLLVVHAGSVAIGGAAVLFCGEAGIGKSTLTGCLALRGHDLVSDDLCRLALSPEGTPVVYPASGQLRLWRDALELVGLSENGLERDHFRFDKYIAPWRVDIQKSPLPLGGIYLLGWGDMKLRRLSGMRAVNSFIRAATYRGKILEQMGRTAAYWQACLELLQGVPVWEITRPKNLAALDEMADLLEKQWQITRNNDTT